MWPFMVSIALVSACIQDTWNTKKESPFCVKNFTLNRRGGNYCRLNKLEARLEMGDIISILVRSFDQTIDNTQWTGETDLK